MTHVRNPFDAGGNSLAEMTQAIILPNLYTRLGRIGLFRFEGVTQRSEIIEQYEGVMNLLPSVPLGGPATGAVFEQEITADLLANTRFLSPRLCLNIGATIAAVAHDCAGGAFQCSERTHLMRPVQRESQNGATDVPAGRFRRARSRALSVRRQAVAFAVRTSGVSSRSIACLMTARLKPMRSLRLSPMSTGRSRPNCGSG